ncbi:12914_t:CDS:1, partial [Gigaspora rosea]
ISTIAFDVQFSPDPITKPGKDVTTFTANGGIIRSNGTSQGSSHGDVFSENAVIYVDYVSSIEGVNPSFMFPVPPGNKDFSMPIHIATPFSTSPNYILKFNL